MKTKVLLMLLLPACSASTDETATPVVQALVGGPPCPTRDAVSFQLADPAVPDCVRPPVPGWTVNELVRSPAGMYCWYRGPASDGPLDFVPLEAIGAQRDCPLLIPQQREISPSDGDRAPEGKQASAPLPLVERFARLADLPVGAPPALAPVHVSVLDTSPGSYARKQTDTYLHGRGVARVIASLACPDPRQAECAKRIEGRLALSYRQETPNGPVTVDDVNGGTFGTRAELVFRVRRVLDELETADPDRRAILNLSLTWEPEADAVYPDTSKHALELLFQRAACMGVLIIAAAGNGRGGPALPGGWEVKSAPDETQCRALGFPIRAPFAVKTWAAPYRPLVYSVGAVDATDRPLATTRPGSLPRTLAYGMNVITGLSLGDSVSPPPFTGTSMSTAIVSGAAAAVWGYLPEADPHEVMAIVYDTAVTLNSGGPEVDNKTTQVCVGRIDCELHQLRRVSVCAAAAAAIRSANSRAAASVTAREDLLHVPRCRTVKAHGWTNPYPPVISKSPQGGTSKPCTRLDCTQPPAGHGLDPWTDPTPNQPSCPVHARCGLTRPFFGNRYLVGETASTWPNNGYDLDVVLLPYFHGWALQPEYFRVPNTAHIWLGHRAMTQTLTSASMRFEWVDFTNMLVDQSNATAIEVDL